MIKITDKRKCTGCSACVNICPKKAITFECDKAGYNYPVVDSKKCIDCSLCDKICPMINPVDVDNNYDEPLVKAAWNKDEQIRINSTSGGIFTAIAQRFIEKDGYVVGAEYSEDFGIRHSIISKDTNIVNLRQSKYAQSDLGDVFVSIKRLLQDNKQVLFCGSPCQVAGLRKYLLKDYDNLFIVDFICRGIISQKIYKNYLDSVEKHTNSKISKVHFKNKDFGWNRFSTKISLENGEFYHKDRYNDEYMKGYLKYNLYLRPCCYDCQFKTLPRLSDLTLGDFWGIGNSDKSLDNDKGTSVVLINSDKGREFFNNISDLIFATDSSLEQVKKGNACLFNKAEEGKYSEYFYKNFEKKDFIDLINKIDEKELWDRDDLSIRDRLYLLKNKLMK